MYFDLNEFQKVSHYLKPFAQNVMELMKSSGNIKYALDVAIKCIDIAPEIKEQFIKAMDEAYENADIVNKALLLCAGAKMQWDISNKLVQLIEQIDSLIYLTDKRKQAYNALVYLVEANLFSYHQFEEVIAKLFKGSCSSYGKLLCKIESIQFPQVNCKIPLPGIIWGILQGRIPSSFSWVIRLADSMPKEIISTVIENLCREFIATLHGRQPSDLYYCCMNVAEIMEQPEILVEELLNLQHFYPEVANNHEWIMAVVDIQKLVHKRLAMPALLQKHLPADLTNLVMSYQP